MRAALAALLLLVLAPVQAQLVVEKPKPAAKEKTPEKKPAAKQDAGRPAETHHKTHPSHHPTQRPPETRETSEGKVKLDRARPESQRPTTPPSPAQQYQQQQYEQRQIQQQNQVQGSQPQQSRVVQCMARPVCGGAGYGRCAAVSQSFPGMTAQAGRREIVQRCIEANTPDSCNCAAQCTSVARCSIF